MLACDLNCCNSKARISLLFSVTLVIYHDISLADTSKKNISLYLQQLAVTNIIFRWN